MIDYKKVLDAEREKLVEAYREFEIRLDEGGQNALDDGEHGEMAGLLAGIKALDTVAAAFREEEEAVVNDMAEDYAAMGEDPS